MRSIALASRTVLISGVSLLALLNADVASAQTANAPVTPGPTAAAPTVSGAYNELDEIIVTAQRQSQSLQDVPISVSAFTAQALQAKQINNASDLQLSLPNVTFTKGNFTGSSFTIRGVGDLCVGFSCDSATGIHINDMPLLSTRLFETEYLDLERVEVLRGPQGTLFGRNATSGVVNFITARPDLKAIHATAYGEYGNFNSYRVNGMINVPLNDKIGIRVAGNYLKRGGFTHDIYDNSQIDGRNQYSVRGTLRFQPTDTTTLDLIGYYFHEGDNRSRIQKQLCHRDVSGVLGCSPDFLTNQTTNGNASLGSIFNSQEFIRIGVSPALVPFALGSVYGRDIYANAVNPADLRSVNVDYKPTYNATEQQYQARLEQRFGDALKLTVIGGYTRNTVDSTTDYANTVADPYSTNPTAATALATLNASRASPTFAKFATAIIPNGPGSLCVSQQTHAFVGIYGGQTYGCAANQQEFDRSDLIASQYSLEGHIDSSFDGKFNFLVGAIYVDGKVTGDYYVNATGLDYSAGLIGAGATNGAAFYASPYFDSLTDNFRLKSYGIFGEGYFQATNKLKLTVGLRYSHDSKSIIDRNLLFNAFAPYGTTDFTSAPAYATADYNASIAGNQPNRTAAVSFGRLTGRAVIDYKISDTSLLYASYSRGYKSGGINPPFNPALFSAPTTFLPESIDAIEIGSKNTFANGAVRLNVSGFYYKYKNLQVSRILARTSFNDNTDAEIYGAEVEAIVAPIPPLVFNIQFSYLKTKIKNLSLSDTRDPSGGRSDSVIIKDVTTAANCVVTPTVAGNAVGSNTFVTIVNSALGLRAPVPIVGTSTTGAFSVCSTLASLAQNPNALGATLGGALRGALGTPTGSLPFLFNVSPTTGAATGLPDGNPINLNGNSLPNSPEFKVGIGAQYTFDFGNGFSLVPRVDYNFTDSTFSRTFNKPIDRIPYFDQIDMQVTLNGPDNRYYVRAFVQNLENNNSITGQYVTDASAGLFTNVFTLEPRRFGVGAGIKF